MLNYRIYLSVLVGFLLVLGAIAAGAQERFIDNGDGTVSDTQLDLMWAQTDNQADIFWEQAPTWIRNNFTDQVGSRYDDWRLPTLRELKSLYLESADYDGYKTQCGH